MQNQTLYQLAENGVHIDKIKDIYFHICEELKKDKKQKSFIPKERERIKTRKGFRENFIVLILNKNLYLLMF